MSRLGSHPALAHGGTWAYGPIEWRFTMYQEELDRDVAHVTVIPFVGPGCIVVRTGRGDLTFPGGTVEPDEHWVNTALREVREEAGASLRSLHPFGVFHCRSSRHRRYRDHLPHPSFVRIAACADVVVDGVPNSPPGAKIIKEVLVLDPREAAPLLALNGSPEFAELGLLAADERTELTDEAWFNDNRLLLEKAYLAQADRYGQSGKSGGAASWELGRRFTAGAIHRDGTFLDLGCANGLLMESMVSWASRDVGFVLEPYGLDISSALVELARRRLPQWEDRLWVGNAWDWAAPRKFDFVHALPELVPDHLRGKWLRRLLDEFVAPAGRLILRSGDPYPMDPDQRTLP